MENKEKFLLKNFWNNCIPSFAHLNPRIYSGDEIKNLNLYNSTILDFGCGGGWWGKLLFKTFNIKKYIGIDISERSLHEAYNNLEGYNTHFYLNKGQDLSQYKADILICFAVIHHFPNIEYLNNFLDNVNNSNIKELFLSIKYCINKDYEFIENCYDSFDYKKIGNACKVNIDYLKYKLNNYQLIRIGKEDKKGKQCSLIWRKLNENKYLDAN